MAKKKSVRRTAKKTSAAATRPAARRRPARSNPLVAAMEGAISRSIGGVQLDVGRAGASRVKRMIYPAGFRWSTHMKPLVGTEYCRHAHAAFLAQGEFRIEFPDGCLVSYKAPAFVSIEPGHDGWVVGRESVVLIEFDFEDATVARLGMPDAHRHPDASAGD